MSNGDLLCTTSAIHSAPDVCQYATEACQDSWSYFNFTAFYFCHLNENLIVMLVLSLIFLFYLFSFLGKVADSYLAPSLQVLSRKLNLSEAIAGATLLALGGSAPNVITGIVVGISSSQSMDVAVGGLFGSCLFTITIIIAVCIKGATIIHIDASALKRDAFFLLAGVSYFIFLTIMDQVTPLLASGFFFIYFLYVLYIIIHQRMQSREEKSNETSPEAITAPSSLLILHQSLLDNAEGGSFADEKYEPVSVPRDEKPFDNFKHSKGPTFWRKLLRKSHSGEVITSNEMSPLSPKKTGYFSDVTEEEEEDKSPQQAVQQETQEKFCPKKKGEQNIMSIKIKLKEERKKGKILKPSLKKQEPLRVFRITSFVEETQKKGVWNKIKDIVFAPMVLVSILTIPPFQEEKWNKYTVALTPYFSILFIIWQVEAIEYMIRNWYLWIVYGVVASSLAILLYWKGRKENLAKKHEGKFALLAFMMSTVWLNLITNLIVEYLGLVEVLSNLPLSFISLTIFAWGTSVDDLIVNTVLSKSGFGKMAIIGAYGSQVFTIFIGFGAALFLQSLNETISMSLYDFETGDIRSQLLSIILLGAMFITLIITLIFSKKNGWKFNTNMAIFLPVTYLVFFAVFTVISFV